MLGFDGCEPGAVEWVETYFRDCVYDNRDKIGFVLGLCSIFVWLTAQLPQFISNIKNQSSEALSIWFLVEWFAGDTLNLLGCLIQGQQLPTTTILAAYFVLVDVIMLLQYIYYGALQARRRRLRARAQRKRHQHHHSHQRSRETSNPNSIAVRQSGIDVAMPFSNCPSTCEQSDASSTQPMSARTRRDQTSPFISPSPSPSPGPVATRWATGGSNPVATNMGSAGGVRNATVVTFAGLSLVCVAALAMHSASRSLPGTAAAAAGGIGSHLGTGGGGDQLSRRHLQHLLGGDTSSRLWLHGADGVGVDGVGAGVDAAGAGADVRVSSREQGPWWRHPCSFLNCDWALLAGTAMGYLSTCFYLASRISQIRKNVARKSTEGLSPVMFVMTMSANMCTGLSIVIRLRTALQFREQLPWMCGTFGTIALDATLLTQVFTLGNAPPQDAAGHTHGHSHSHGPGHTSRTHNHGHSHPHAHGGANGAAQGRPHGSLRDGGWPDGGLQKVSDLEAPLLGPQPTTVGGQDEALTG